MARELPEKEDDVWVHKLPKGLDVLWDTRCLTCGRGLAKHTHAFESLLKQGWKPNYALDELGITSYCCRMRILSPSIISAPYSAHPGFVNGTYPIESVADPQLELYENLRNMRVIPPSEMVSSKKAEKEFQLQRGSTRSKMVIAEDILEKGRAASSSTLEVIVRDPISGLSLIGGREIVGWADPGEGFRIPILKGVYSAR